MTGLLRAISTVVLLLTSAASGATQPASAPASRPVPKDFAEPAGGFARDPKTGAINKVAVEGANEKAAWFQLAVPQVYTPDRAWPLMIVLHGGPGGNGPDDIITFFRGGLLAQGVISVYPNAIQKQVLEWNYPHEGANLIAIIRQVAKTYRVDPSRIYLVGVSMGGGGTWATGAVMRDVFAGLGPVAGWYQPTPAPLAEWLKGVPIYCLHGEKDSAVPVSRAQLALKDMKRIGHEVLEVANLADFKTIGKETMVYRVVPGGQHNVLLPWATQGRLELGKMIGWLLAQKRSAPADLEAAEKALADWGKKFGWEPGGVLGKYRE